MNRIRSLKLENFESWEFAKFEFHPGVNVFVGLSDSGKSSVLRAFYLLIENKPSGDDYRSTFVDKRAITIVTGKFEDGVIVSRRRGNSINQYTLQLPGQDEQIFEAFKTSIPDEIANAINLNSVNIQRQVELPFLLSQNAADRGRFFNEVAGLDKIDSSQKYANGKVLEAGREQASCEKEMERITEELKTLEFIPALETRVEALEKLDGEKKQTEIKIWRMHKVFDSLQAVNSELAELEKVNVAKISKKIQLSLANIQEHERKAAKLEKCSTVFRRHQAAKQELRDIGGTNLQAISQKVVSALRSVVKYREKRRDLSRIKLLLESNIQIKTQLKKAEESLITALAEFKKMIPDVCPLCKRKGWKNAN